MRHFPSLLSVKRTWLTATSLGTVLVVGTLHAETWVITDQAHPVTGRADRLILLDAPARIEAELASGLPVDPVRAESLARDRLSYGGADLQRRIAIAYQGVTDAWSFGITSIPAVVVDQRYVVYGEPDVVRAVARIEQYRRAQP
ncbi:TIGR03757 family integrating conjugative element protein [Hydrogenophaga sp. NFH-34]|uniref:TIGR03757 family integrating conjugative element protein n=1 Tax=Hydrogenophaga sp. NFH-34 TaxID=2744446 RepID=UPI001F3686C6|nr:TIGR03757 family integrating conjugative element protein [Hydrogenophaga sp. NFH-34]